MLNSLILKKIWLKNDELPVLIIRESYINWFWSWLSAIIILAGDFFLMFWLFRFDVWGLIFFITALIISLFILARAWWQYYFTAWVLTNIRLIDIHQAGFFRRDISEVVYSSIKEVYAQKRGFVRAISGTGDLILEIKDSQVKYRLPLVRGYERAISEIVLQKENYQRFISNKGERRAQFLLNKIKIKLGEKVFNELIGD